MIENKIKTLRNILDGSDGSRFPEAEKLANEIVILLSHGYERGSMREGWGLLLLGGKTDPGRWASYHEMGAYGNRIYGTGNWTYEYHYWKAELPKGIEPLPLVINYTAELMDRTDKINQLITDNQ